MLSNMSSKCAASLVLLLSLARFGTAQVNASTLISSSTTCGQQCQLLAATGFAFETSVHASANLSFYVTPDNFSKSLEPGQILHVEYATNLSAYTVPSGLTMSRIIYTTADLNGTVLPASAYVLWPYEIKEEYPMVGWTHGTSGLFKACAPSNYRSLQYHFMVPYLLALQGIVVVAPDYAGLGIDTLPSGERFNHPWALSSSQAADMAHAITAARAAFPKELPPKGPFVSLGHSQGGGAAWAFAERMVTDLLEGYMGTVSIAPVTGVVKTIELALANPSLPWAPVVLGLQTKLIHSVTAAFPGYNYSGFTPLSADRWLNVARPLSICLPSDGLIFADVPPAQLAQPGWIKDPTVQLYGEMGKVSRKEFKGPLLVLAGEGDSAAAVDIIKSAFNDTCDLNEKNNWGQSLEFVSFADMDHFAVIQASSSLWLDWIKARLAGKEPPKPGCESSLVDGFRTDFTVHGTPPNFLVDWASPMERWKYSL